MQVYGQKEVEVLKLNRALDLINEKTLQFQEYKKAKQ